MVCTSPTPPKKSPRKAKSSQSARASAWKTASSSPLDVQVGDRILFGKYSGSDIKLDGEEYLIMREDEVLGILDSCSPKWRRKLAKESIKTMAKQIVYSEEFPSGDSARRQPAGRCRESHARPQGPQRGSGEEVRRPEHHQGRRDGGQGNRAEGSAREHGRADGARSGLQDLRCGRRRHHHRDHSGAGDLPRRREGRCGRRQPDGAEARHREGRGSGRRGSEEALQAGFR